MNKDGIAASRSKFDDRGNAIETAYFGADGQPVLNKDGYAGWRSKFDDRGNAIETAYFGADGQPVLNNDGCGVGAANSTIAAMRSRPLISAPTGSRS